MILQIGVSGAGRNARRMIHKCNFVYHVDARSYEYGSMHTVHPFIMQRHY